MFTCEEDWLDRFLETISLSLSLSLSLHIPILAPTGERSRKGQRKR